jgi:hypothetical protein
MAMTIRCRNDYVLLRAKTVDKRGTLYVPPNSREGTEYVVEEVGPKVEGLKAGDKVLMNGIVGQHWLSLPNDSSLFICREDTISLVFEGEWEPPQLKKNDWENSVNIPGVHVRN